MRDELLKGLTEEQIAKVKACKNQEEMLAVAKEEGIELTEEQLEVVSGGACTTTPPAKPTVCPYCGADKIMATAAHNGNKPGCPLEYYSCQCKKCGSSWISR